MSSVTPTKNEKIVFDHGPLTSQFSSLISNCAVSVKASGISSGPGRRSAVCVRFSAFVEGQCAAVFLKISGTS